MDPKRIWNSLSKADFADAVGIAIGHGAMAMALVGKRFNSVSVRALEERPLEVPQEGRWPVVAEMVREFVAEHGAEEARIALALGPSDGLLGHMQLPSTAVENLDRVVLYEFDRVIPIAADQVFCAHAWRPLGRSGERIAVAVVAAARQQVIAARDELLAVGCAPNSVTVTAAALSDYYGFAAGEDSGTAGIFFRDGDRERMTLCTGGRLVSSVHFNSRREARSDRLTREIETLAPDLTEGDAVLIVDDPDAEEEVSLASIAPEGFLPAASRPGWLQAAAVGAALAQIGESRSGLNLLPAELAKAEEGVGLRELGLAAAVVVLSAVLAITIGIKNLSIGGALASELERLSPQVASVQSEEEKSRALLADVEPLEAHRRVSVLAYLEAMTSAVPRTAYLTTFRYKGDRLEVDGIARSASELISVLERSPLFKNVEFTSPTTKYLQDQERFSLRMELER